MFADQVQKMLAQLLTSRWFSCASKSLVAEQCISFFISMIGITILTKAICLAVNYLMLGTVLKIAKKIKKDIIKILVVKIAFQKKLSLS
jgi:hypothetical protein